MLRGSVLLSFSPHRTHRGACRSARPLLRLPLHGRIISCAGKRKQIATSVTSDSLTSSHYINTPSWLPAIFVGVTVVLAIHQLMDYWRFNLLGEGSKELVTLDDSNLDQLWKQWHRAQGEPMVDAESVLIIGPKAKDNKHP
eukprot:gene30059-35027_t